jgi:multiple sugar transport system substrate-binding protein
MAPGEGFEGLMLSNGAGPYIEQVSEGEFKVTFNDDEAIATGQYVMEDLGIDNISRADEDLEEFLSGNAAMTYAGSWELAQLNDSDVNYMYLPQPTGPDADEPSTWSAGVFYGVPPNASDAAIDWLEFILSTEQQQSVPDATGGFPGRADVYETDDFQEFVQSDPTIEVIAQEMQRTSPFPPIIGVSQLLNEIGRPAIERVYQGQESPEEAFSNAAEEMVSEIDQIVQA